MSGIAATTKAAPAAEIALDYHARSKHKLERYAAGPETLDWDMQPNPFREFSGCLRTPLPLSAHELDTNFEQIYAPASIAPEPLNLRSVGIFMQLSMGLSAWKEYGPDRWALRCNPSSGNLHPTETYILASNLPGLEDGLYHYLSRDHTLELRYLCAGRPGKFAQLWVSLSSVHWREAWKYGERAFRYCQLDIGHALGAIRYAAGALGWGARLLAHLDSAELGSLMGLDRADDFPGVEQEDADLLVAINPYPTADLTLEGWESSTGQWTGRANLLDPHPIYRWPVIDDVSAATRGSSISTIAQSPFQYPSLQHSSKARAADIILGRRSAQRFNRSFVMKTQTFHCLLDRLIARPIAPWDIWDFTPRLHPIFFVHRVEGFEPGLYALPRHPGTAESLRTALRPEFEWKTTENTPPIFP
jgi:nitroreductase